MPTLTLLLALLLRQTTPSSGAIAKFVPPVPTPASFISDAKAVLSPEARATLDARITAIQRAGLGDIAVAILPSIGDYSANQVSVEIYRTWRVGSVANIGSAHRNVGVLILIVPKELAPNNRGECWINTGTGAEGIITDASAGTICRDSIIPHLKNKDYVGGIAAGIGALESKLRGDAGLASPAGARQIVAPPPQESNNSSAPWIIGGLVALFAGLVGGRHWLRYHPRKCPRCGKTMRRLDEKSDNAKLQAGQVVEEKLGSVDYDVWVCECGESLVVPYRRMFTKYSECRKCHRRAASSTRKVLSPATTASSGLAEDRFECKACGATWMVSVVLPQIVVTSSSSGGGGSSSGGGGGGGSSFGGSGSTSGGGGGGSY
jgi:uncharacterized protein